jgi:hypothetical protein
VGLRRGLGAQRYIHRVRLVIRAGLKSSVIGLQCILVNRRVESTTNISEKIVLKMDKK